MSSSSARMPRSLGEPLSLRATKPWADMTPAEKDYEQARLDSIEDTAIDNLGYDPLYWQKYHDLTDKRSLRDAARRKQDLEDFVKVEAEARGLTLCKAEDLKLEKGKDLQLEKAEDLKLSKSQHLKLEKGQDLKLEKAEDLKLEKAEDLKLEKGQDLKLETGKDLKLEKVPAGALYSSKRRKLHECWKLLD